MKPSMNFFGDVAFKHSTPIQIRFDDIDGMGHVNNTILLSYFDYAKVKYLNQINDKLPESEKQGVVIARYEADFFKPIFLNDDIYVESAIIGFGTKSLVFAQRVRTQKEIKCVCKTIMSGFDKESYSSALITDGFKNEVLKFEERTTFSTI